MLNDWPFPLHAASGPTLLSSLRLRTSFGPGQGNRSCACRQGLSPEPRGSAAAQVSRQAASNGASTPHTCATLEAVSRPFNRWPRANPLSNCRRAAAAPRRTQHQGWPPLEIEKNTSQGNLPPGYRGDLSYEKQPWDLRR